MENEERKLPLRKGTVELDFTPFQLRTLKVAWRRQRRRRGR